jgi:phage/plasmid-associated DNA primase
MKLEELKRLAAKKIKVGQDVGVDEAQRFLNANLIKTGQTPVLFAYLYYLYVKWRKDESKSYISRRHFGRLLKTYLQSGKTKIGPTNYVTYKLTGIEQPKRIDAAWKLLWYEQSKKKKKTRRS